MRFPKIIAAVLFATGLTVTAGAHPISYTLTGTLSGSIELKPFDNAAFTWTITGDTTKTQKLPDGSFGVRALAQSLSIAGMGSMEPADAIVATPGAPLFPTFAFATSDGLGGIGFFAPQLAAYDGLSPIGPIPVNLTGTFLVSTDRGVAFFESGDLTFQTTGAAEVPEPVTLALFGAGLAGLGALRRWVTV